MISYLLARLRYEIPCWWLILTGRGQDDAPDSLLDAYKRQATAWIRWKRTRNERPVFILMIAVTILVALVLALS